MANTFVTPSVIAKEALVILENQLISPNLMSKAYASEWTGAKVGSTVKVRRPAAFAVDTYTGSGTTDVTIQQATETTTDLEIEKLFDVSFAVTNQDLTLSLDNFNERLLTPAMSALAQQIDTYALGKIPQLGSLQKPAYNSTAAPSTKAHWAAIIEKMNNHQMPMNGRKCVISPSMMTSLYALDDFVRVDIRGGSQSPLIEATLGRWFGMDIVMSQNLPTHTPGALTTGANKDGAFTTTGTHIEGATTLNLTAGEASITNAFLAGDHINITYDSGDVRTHVVRTAANTAGSGVVALDIRPGLYNLPAAGYDPGTSGITVLTAGQVVKNYSGEESSLDDGASPGSGMTTSYLTGASFLPEAFALCFVPMSEPMGPGTASAVASYNGMSVRVMQTYDQLKKRDIISLDCLVGADAVDARLGLVIPSAA